MAFESPAFANSGGSSTYSAEQTRRSVFFWAARTASNTPGIIAGGVGAAGDLAVSAPASGMSVNIAPGECLTGGGEGAHQGGYYGLNTATITLPISAASPSLPRIDTVVATISDSGYTEPTGGSGNQVTAQVLTGTPTASASLANLAGAATLSLSSLVLAYVLVPANATNIITADILNVAQPASLGLSGSSGVTNIATSQSTSSTSFTTLSTPDQVSGLVVPVNGLIAVQYQALWAMSNASSVAAIFVNSNQLKVQAYNSGTRGPQLQQAAVSLTPVNVNVPLFTIPTGLATVTDTGTTAYKRT